MQYAKIRIVVRLFFCLIFLLCLTLTGGVYAACPNPDGCDPDPTLNPPSTPSGVAATWWYTPEVNLSWNASTSPGGYSITYGVYRSTTSPVSMVLGNRIASVSSTSYRDLSVTTNVTYYYKVVASDANGDSSPSNEVNARPLPWPPLPTVSGLTATSVSYAQINLSWSAVSYPSGEFYRIYRSTTSGFPIGASTLLATSTRASYIDLSVNASTTYYYKVTFVNDENNAEGSPSSQASATSSTPAVVSYSYGGAYGGPHALTSDGSRTFYYDANGNLSQRSKPSATDTCFYYTLSNKLQEVKNGTGCATKIATYFYDMDGNRIEEIVYGTPTTTRFFPSLEMEGTNLKYSYSAGGMRLAEEGPNGFYFYHGDHLASTSVVTRLDGTRAKEITYYPFGAVESETTFTGSDPGQTNHKYNDKFHDKETNYYDYGARFYDASIGRFTVPDTVVPSATSSQSLNRYSYVENNPLKYVDPSGHEEEAASSTPPLIPAHENTGATASDVNAADAAMTTDEGCIGPMKNRDDEHEQMAAVAADRKSVETGQDMMRATTKNEVATQNASDSYNKMPGMKFAQYALSGGRGGDGEEALMDAAGIVSAFLPVSQSLRAATAAEAEVADVLKSSIPIRGATRGTFEVPRPQIGNVVDELPSNTIVHRFAPEATDAPWAPVESTRYGQPALHVSTNVEDLSQWVSSNAQRADSYANYALRSETLHNLLTPGATVIRDPYMPGNHAYVILYPYLF